ncbi:MAG: SPFH domain-containing protein [Eubacterium sp.]|nr:SPFH domain-containing protein [Eubacterium sp.]
MGIIKAAGGAVGGVFADQWLEMYVCESMPEDVLAQRGVKRVNENSSNTKGEENVITDGSLIIVNDGQCAIVIEQGKCIGIYDNPGENVFRSKRTGSIFSGGGLKSIGKQTVERIGFGGDVAIHQFVMYIDTKEKVNNPFALSVPLSIVNKATGLDYYSTVNISGVFSYRITNPEIFYKRICGNSTGTVTRAKIQPQLNAELRSAAVTALDKLCGGGVEPTALAQNVENLCAELKAALDEKWESLRGFSVVSIAIDGIALAQDDKRVIQEAERAKMLTQPDMAAATLVAAQADAMNAAAHNHNGGSMVGAFAVMNAMNTGTQQSEKPNIFLQNDSSKPSLWRCTCGNMNTGNFCENCGKKRV